MTTVDAFIEAAKAGDLAAVQRFVEEEEMDVNAADPSGYTVLHGAAWGGSVGVARYLLGRDADISARNGRGNTVLHEAVEGRSFEMIKFLVKQKPRLKVRAMNKDKRTAADLANEAGYIEIVKFLESLPDDDDDE